MHFINQKDPLSDFCVPCLRKYIGNTWLNYKQIYEERITIHVTAAVFPRRISPSDAFMVLMQLLRDANKHFCFVLAGTLLMLLHCISKLHPGCTVLLMLNNCISRHVLAVVLWILKTSIWCSASLQESSLWCFPMVCPTWVMVSPSYLNYFSCNADVVNSLTPRLPLYL